MTKHIAIAGLFVGLLFAPSLVPSVFADQCRSGPDFQACLDREQQAERDREQARRDREEARRQEEQRQRERREDQRREDERDRRERIRDAERRR